jgi:hypothetical protein
MVLKSVGVLSVGKVLGCLYALMGLIFGGFVSLLALGGAAAGGRLEGPSAMLFGAGAVVLLPIFYGLGGFIGGIISAFLYNIVASMIGGIEMELSHDGDTRWE